MAVNIVVDIAERKYDSNELDRPTTAPAYKSTTVIKYMATRTLGLNLSNSFQGSLRNFELNNSVSNFQPSPITTSHGLASLVESPSLSRMSSFDSIDGELTLDEHRDLSKLNETLAENILHCCNLDVHNRAQELQLEWLENHSNKNSLTIEKMFRTEIQTGRQLIEDTLRYKPDLEKKLNDIHQATLSNDEHYQQLLSKRNAINKELFQYQRQLAQNRAESEFLRYRLQLFNEEIQFYKLKNNSLQARQIKLHYELDEEMFAKQVLQMECQVLENEKITNEDMHLSSIDDIRGSIDLNQITTIQPSNYYREQLNHQLRRMRLEYNKKLQIYRDELHRKFELESYRYNMHKSRPIPTVTKEHEQKLEEYKREKRDVDQEISSVRSSFNELVNQIEVLETHIDQVQITLESTFSSERHLIMLGQIIQEKEHELNEVIRLRTLLKQQIEYYRDEADRKSKGTLPRKSILRTSISQESLLENNRQEQTIYLSPRSTPSAVIRNKETSVEEGTLTRYSDFNVEQDCEELNRIFNELNVDIAAIIEIFCNRNIGQRLQIRDTYKILFGQNLGNIFESELHGNSKKILQLLLLSPIERDCFEFRRVLKTVNIDENILIEIFLTRSNKQLKTIINNYSKLFKNTLEQDIIDARDTSSKPIFLALLQADRPEDEDINDNEILDDDARNLYETNSQWRVDGSTFIQLLYNRSNVQLKHIFNAYEQFSRVDIEQAIKIDTDAYLSRTLMAIVRIVRNRPRFFAYQLRKSLKGSGTNEDNVNRIIISRCEIDMIQIKYEYEKISKRTLYDHIQTDTTGDYKRVLLELLRQRIELTNKNLPYKKFLEPPELPKKLRRSVQWKETDVNNADLKQFIQFDRNNQAKSNTLATINPRLSKSQFIQRRSYSNECLDE